MPKEASNGSFFAVLPQSHAREGEREEEGEKEEEREFYYPLSKTYTPI